MPGSAFDRILLRDTVDNLRELLSPEQHDLDLGLPTSLPVALLPVRLEARFVGTPAADGTEGAPWTLKVRSIPDDIHIPTLSGRVTAKEAELAAAFASGATDSAAEWDALVSASGPGNAGLNRAAWLATRALAGDLAVGDGSPLVAHGLPDRWFVSAWSGGALVGSRTSDPVKRDLPVDPSAKPAETAWLTDFDAAMAVGMAVELPVPEPSLDVLIAVGVSSDAGADELQALLDLQAYSRGVDLLPPGTPTNNTPSTRSAWRSQPDHAEMLQRVRAIAAAAEPEAGTDGLALTVALGLPSRSAALSSPAAAAGTGLADARAMLDLLWPVTGGELLGVLLDDPYPRGTGIEQDMQDAIREHASAWVRGRGPLPPVLVGRQPYGVLPVTSLRRWARGDDPAFLDGMRRRLLAGWAVWESAIAQARRRGGVESGDDATQLVARLLAQSPVPEPTGYRATVVTPPQASRTLPYLWLGGPLDADLTTGLLQLDYAPLLSDCKEDTSRVGDVVLPAVAPGGAARLGGLRTGDEPLIALILRAEGAKEDLLGQLAQRALLRSAERAATYLGSRFVDGVKARVESASAVSLRAALVNDLATTEVRSPLACTLADLAPGLENAASVTLGEAVADPSVFSRFEIETPPQSPEHSAAVTAVERLSQLDAAGEGRVDDETLELLMGETLDVFTNRFDAWATSLATRRLGDLRSDTADGVHLGAFGWLVDVHRPQAVRPGAGLVHAPSPAHAATSAVLRNADIDDRAASLDPSGNARRFDVTSASARRARGILDAVRHGQPLSAVLGYRIERFLQDSQQPQAIPDLRDRFGTVGGEVPDTTTVQEAVPAHDVVDGVAVWRARGTLAQHGLAAELEFTMDALSDLLVAEGVHQIVRGDHGRAGATITALSRGVPPPAERHGREAPGRHLSVPVQALLTAGDPSTAHGWASTLRAQVAPLAEAVLQARFPAADRCGFLLDCPAHDGQDASTVTVTLDQLHVSALDLVAASGDDDEQSALAARVRSAAGRPGRLLPGAAPGSDAGWGAVTALARLWSRVLASSRPLVDADVVLEEDGVDATPAADAGAAVEPVLAALRSAVDAANQAAARLRAALDSLGAGSPSEAFSATVQADLALIHQTGLVASPYEPGADAAVRARHCVTAVDVAASRLAQLDADAGRSQLAQPPAAALSPAERMERVAAAVRDLLGDVVVISPPLTRGTAMDAASWDAAGSDDVLDWLGELSEVRGPSRRLWQALLASESLLGTPLTAAAAQYPVVHDEGWIGGWSGEARAWRPPRGTAPCRRRSARPRCPVDGDVRHRRRQLGGAGARRARGGAGQGQAGGRRRDRAPRAHRRRGELQRRGCPPPAVDPARGAAGPVGCALAAGRSRRDPARDDRADAVPWHRRAGLPAEPLGAAGRVRARGDRGPVVPRRPPRPARRPRPLDPGDPRAEVRLMADAQPQSWTRIRPQRQTNDPSVGLAARIADPLWLLCRQLQMTEFTGDDGGTPTSLTVHATWVPFTHWAPGSSRSGSTVAWQPYDRDVPLEPLVEDDRMLVGGEPPPLLAAVEAGQRLVRRLRAAGLEELASSEALVRVLAPRRPSTSAVHVHAGRTVDGFVVRARFDDVSTALRAAHRGRDGAVEEVLDEWRSWFDRRFGHPSHGTSWITERLEYQFYVAAPHPDGGALVLRSPEYLGDGVDWSQLELTTEIDPPSDVPADRAVVSVQRHAYPQPVRWPGMPVDRFWEMEDGAVDLGALSLDPADLPGMLALDMAATAGTDWFVAEHPLPAAGVARIDKVEVTDTFGSTVTVSAAKLPEDIGLLFTPSSGGRDGGGWLVLPPRLPARVDGPTREEVLLVRDEVANLGWIIERTGSGEDGEPGPLRPQPNPSPPPTPEGALTYRLTSGSPDTWLPLVPFRDGDERMLLGRGRMFDQPEQVLPTTMLARHIDVLMDEEVPREGKRISRSWQYARWFDGSRHLWCGRTVDAGFGEATSALRFDDTY